MYFSFLSSCYFRYIHTHKMWVYVYIYNILFFVLAFPISFNIRMLLNIYSFLLLVVVTIIMFIDIAVFCFVFFNNFGNSDREKLFVLDRGRWIHLENETFQMLLIQMRASTMAVCPKAKEKEVKKKKELWVDGWKIAVIIAPSGNFKWNVIFLLLVYKNWWKNAIKFDYIDGEVVTHTFSWRQERDGGWGKG